MKHVQKLKKIHKAIEFEWKETWEPYNESYTEKKHARNEFEKDTFKILNNHERQETTLRFWDRKGWKKVHAMCY